MEKLSGFGYLLIGFVVIIALKIYSESDVFNLKCIISGVDGNKYCVRERFKLQLAADLLATVTQKLKKLVAYMKEKYPERPNVERLVENFNPKKVKEILKAAYKESSLNYMHYHKINKKFYRKNEVKILTSSKSNHQLLKKRFKIKFNIYGKKLVKKMLNSI